MYSFSEVFIIRFSEWENVSKAAPDVYTRLGPHTATGFARLICNRAQLLMKGGLPKRGKKKDSYSLTTDK